MTKYRCSICGYICDTTIEDLESNIKAGTEFKDLPSDWECVVCSADKSYFDEIAE